MASSTLQGALKDGFGEAVEVHDMCQDRLRKELQTSTFCGLLYLTCGECEVRRVVSVGMLR